LLRSIRRKIRKPYICRYPEKALEEITWAIDRDSSAVYVQQICFKYDPFQPNKPSVTQVGDYMRWYKEQKKMTEDENNALIGSLKDDGLQNMIDKTMDGRDPSKMDLMQAQTSLLAKLKLRMELLQRASVGGIDVDHEGLIVKFVTESAEIIDKITKISGKVLPDGSRNTVNIYNHTPEEIFTEVFQVVMRAIRKAYPQHAGELEKLIAEEFNQFIKPQKGLIDVTPSKENG